ncbi:hypothetical protein GGI21_005188, partial [Coemansia aciculifera]
MVKRASTAAEAAQSSLGSRAPGTSDYAAAAATLTEAENRLERVSADLFKERGEYN